MVFGDRDLAGSGSRALASLSGIKGGASLTFFYLLSRKDCLELMPGRKRHICVSPASPQILYFTNGQLYPTGSKAKRASLLQNPPTAGVATLKLTDVYPSDTGTYLCQVNNPPDFYTNGLGLINLTVLGKAGWGPTSHPCTMKASTGPAKYPPPP